MHVSFRINSYTVEEWPTQELDDLDNFCIGEEQSTSTVVALSWSPIGLAKHKRSALAVLATNQVLSLWASVSDLKAASTWERVLVVNTVLGRPGPHITPRDEGLLTSGGILRGSTRVRSMSWAPVISNNSAHYKNNFQIPSSEICRPVQYLAVTNDADEVVILSIQSEWTHRGKSLGEAQVVSRANWKELRSLFSSPQIPYIQNDNCSTAALTRFEWPSIFAHSFSKNAFIDQVVCTPCQSHRAGFGLILRKGWETLRLEISCESISRGSSINSWIPVSSSKHASSIQSSLPPSDYGSALYLPKTQNSPSYVAIPSAGIIEHWQWKTLLGPKGNAFTNVDIESGAQNLHLTNEWEKISGLAYSSLANGDVVLHACGFLSGPSVFRIESNSIIDEQTEDHYPGPIQSPVNYQVQMLQKDFDQRHDLGGLSIAKTWGLASWGPYLAICISFHPGDMIEYMLTSGERCHIIFSLMDATGSVVEDADFPWQKSSPSFHQEDKPYVHNEVLTKSTFQRFYDFSDCRVLFSTCCAAMISSGTQMAELIETALQQLVTSTGINLELELSLLRDTRSSHLSAASCVKSLNEIIISRSGEKGRSHWQELHDFCSVCDEVILWTSVTEASCVNGHQFARCALTSLPIKEPGVSKYCESCHREFLDESVLSQGSFDECTEYDDSVAKGHRTLENDFTTVQSNPPDEELQPNGEASGHQVPNLGLMNALFAIFDVCPYCEGKYEN